MIGQFLSILKQASKRADEIDNGSSSTTHLKRPYLTVERRYNIHKRTLPPEIDGIRYDKIVVWGCESKKHAENTIQTMTDLQGRHKFATKFVKLDNGKEVVVYYEPIPVNASLKERSPYYNDKLIIEEK